MTIAGSRGAARSQKKIFLKYYPIRSYLKVVLIKIYMVIWKSPVEYLWQLSHHEEHEDHEGWIE
jgi:hypothetical protein